MDDLARLYADNAGILFLAAFVAASIALLVAARADLPQRWWIGAAASGLIVTGLAAMLAFALSGLDTGTDRGISAGGWIAIGVAGVLGFVAGMDVQLAIGQLRDRAGGAGTIVAGAVVGPVVVIGGYLLLVRSMEWVRAGLA
ncbi:MAG: hypothetical protein K5924_02725 [Chloroflexi bacterium]|nr:hypothetical protein [Chloroflexota bacterium]